MHSYIKIETKKAKANTALVYAACFFALLLSWSNSFMYAQTLFEKTYQLNDGGLGRFYSLITNDYLVWTGISIADDDAINIPSYAVWQGALIVTNGNGDTLWTRTYGDSTFKTSYLQPIDNNDGTFFVSGYEADLNNDIYLHFLEQYNFQTGNQINRFVFSDSLQPDANTLLKFSSGDLILSGVYLENGILKSRINRIDLNGNIKWTLNLPSYSNSVNNVIKINENNANIVIVLGYLDANYLDHLVNFTIDTSGQIITTDSFPAFPINSFSCSGVFFPTFNNDEFFITGVFPNPSQLDLVILKATPSNLSFSIIDTLTGTYSDIAGGPNEISNNRAILSGYSNTPSAGMFLDAFSVIIDSSGHFSNQYFFGNPQKNDDFIMTGELNNTFVSFGNSIRNTPNGLRNLAYIVRYDSLGNVSTGNVESLKEQAVQVYPNPAKEELYIKLNGYSQKGETESEYTLFDAKGNSVLIGLLPMNATTSLTVSNLVAGMYCLVVRNGDTFISKKVIIE
jgi:hypothetical protein